MVTAEAVEALACAGVGGRKPNLPALRALWAGFRALHHNAVTDPVEGPNLLAPDRVGGCFTHQIHARADHSTPLPRPGPARSLWGLSTAQQAANPVSRSRTHKPYFRALCCQKWWCRSFLHGTTKSDLAVLALRERPKQGRIDEIYPKLTLLQQSAISFYPFCG